MFYFNQTWLSEAPLRTLNIFNNYKKIFASFAFKIISIFLQNGKHLKRSFTRQKTGRNPGGIIGIL